MSKCTCGRTTNEPWCDGSHTLTETQYQERCREVELDEYKRQAQELWNDSCTSIRSDDPK
jgi:CDGSH-type Zn-finger protein